MIANTRLRLTSTIIFGCWFALSITLDAAEPRGPWGQRLFNGRDLAGWEGAAGYWSVDDGVLVGQTTVEHAPKDHTYLIWRGGEVDDFELRLRFRLINGNSGVQYRSRELPDFGVAGYQCNIQTAKPTANAVLEEMKSGRGGHLAELGERVQFHADGTREVLERFASADSLTANMRHKDWNDLRIRAVGSRLQHFINGSLAIDVVDEQRDKTARSGILALQLHTGPPMRVEFKDIVLEKGVAGRDYRSSTPIPRIKPPPLVTPRAD